MIDAGKTEAEFTLTAHPKITPRDWKIYVQGVSGEDNDWMWASTQMVPLHVEKGYDSLKLSPAQVNAGDKGFLSCEIETIEPFTEEAVIEVSGLPEHVESADVMVKPGQTHVEIPLTIESSASVGSHGGVRASLRVASGKRFVVSQFGPTTLKITEAGESVGEKGAAETDDPPTRSLSRLEQLRLDAKKRQADRSGVSP